MTAHKHFDDDIGLSDGCVDLSADTCIAPITSAHIKGVTGFWFAHDTPSGSRCVGRVPTSDANGGPTWSQTGTLEGGDLTLSPSVLCIAPKGPAGERHGPDFHGFVRGGKWVSA